MIIFVSVKFPAGERIHSDGSLQDILRKGLLGKVDRAQGSSARLILSLLMGTPGKLQWGVSPLGPECWKPPECWEVSGGLGQQNLQVGRNAASTEPGGCSTRRSVRNALPASPPAPWFLPVPTSQPRQQPAQRQPARGAWVMLPGRSLDV